MGASDPRSFDPCASDPRSFDISSSKGCSSATAATTVAVAMTTTTAASATFLTVATCRRLTNGSRIRHEFVDLVAPGRWRHTVTTVSRIPEETRSDGPDRSPESKD